MILCAPALVAAMASAATAPTLAISVRAVPDTRATVEIELRNTSGETLDDRIMLILALLPVVETQGQGRMGTVLWTLFDLDTATSYAIGQPDTPSSRLRLPTGGSRSVMIDLGELRWSLWSALDVGTLHELWEVAEQTEYDLRVTAHLSPEPPQKPRPFERVESRRLRLSLDSSEP